MSTIQGIKIGANTI